MSQLQVLIVVIGGGADVSPMIALGRALVARGHPVRFLSSPYFAGRVRAAGLAFHPCIPREEQGPAIHDPDLWKPGRGYRVIFDGLLNALPETYRAIAAHYVPGRTVIVANAGAMAARIAREALGAPLVTIHLQPILLRSRSHQPGLMMSKRWTPLIRAVRSVLMPAVDRGVFDPLLAPGLNQFRATLGLPPVHRVFAEWIHSPDLVLGLFPEWFARPEPDWPVQAHLTGFPQAEPCHRSPYEHPGLEPFLRAGAPPITFAFGTDVPRPFLDASIEACRQSGRRGLLFTHAAEQLPPLPDFIRHFGEAPCSHVLRRTACLVHHGSIDTMAAAFAAGIPQVVVPLHFDQPDNAARLRALGAGAVIRPAAFTPGKVARTVNDLLASETVPAKCRSLATLVHDADPMGIACDLLEATGGLRIRDGRGAPVS